MLQLKLVSRPALRRRPAPAGSRRRTQKSSPAQSRNPTRRRPAPRRGVAGAIKNRCASVGTLQRVVPKRAAFGRPRCGDLWNRLALYRSQFAADLMQARKQCGFMPSMAAAEVMPLPAADRDERASDLPDTGLTSDRPFRAPLPSRVIGRIDHAPFSGKDPCSIREAAEGGDKIFKIRKHAYRSDQALCPL